MRVLKNLFIAILLMSLTSLLLSLSFAGADQVVTSPTRTLKQLVVKR